MAKQLFSNNSESTLSSGISAGATSLVLQTGDGDRSERAFPNPSGGDWFMATIDDGTYIEIVKCTARSSDTLTTIVRAQEGTTAKAFSAGAKVEVRSTANTFSNWVQMDSSKISTWDDGTGKIANVQPGYLYSKVIADSNAGRFERTSGPVFDVYLTATYAKFLTTSAHTVRFGANSTDLLELNSNGAVKLLGVQGFELASGTPSTTTNKLWQLNGVAYWGTIPFSGFGNLDDFFRMR